MGVIFLIAFAWWAFYGVCFLINDTTMWKDGKKAYKELKAKGFTLQKTSRQLDSKEKENETLRTEVQLLEKKRDQLEATKQDILARHAKSLKVLHFLSLLEYVGAEKAKEVVNVIKNPL